MPSMNIKEYRNCVEKELLAPLVGLGFKASGDHIYYESDNSCLALLRVTDKWSNITQRVSYSVAVRHKFLPDLDRKEITEFVEHPAFYPFNAHPLLELPYFQSRWSKKSSYKYRVGHPHTLDIDYGEGIQSGMLKEIASKLANEGMFWLKSLTPEVAAHQIEKYGNGDYIEQVWLEAYKAHGI